MSARKWRSRWGDHDLEATGRALAEASRRMNLGPLPESVFGRTDEGMADYRGALLKEPVRYLRIHEADFSNASFKQGASINESELVNCILDRVDMRGVFVRRSFEKCSFIEAKLSKCRLGTVFKSCDFSGADLTGSVATGCRFERCIFSGANMAKILYTGCTFDECVFEGVGVLSGSVAGSRFVGRTSLAEFDNCITDNVRVG